MAFMIFVDVYGNEIRREKKGRGRPPKNAVQNDDGDFIVSEITEEDTTIYYIWTDPEGSIIRSQPKGRGRPKPGFVKCPEDGNWYRVETSPVPTK